MSRPSRHRPWVMPPLISSLIAMIIENNGSFNVCEKFKSLPIGFKALFVILICVAASGCETLKAYSGEGAHIIATPTLSSALEAKLSERQKIEVSKITIEKSPVPGEKLWTASIQKTLRQGWGGNFSSNHRARYSLNKGWRENTMRVLRMIYVINPNAEKEVVVNLIADQFSPLKHPIIGGQYWDMSTTVTLNLKTLSNGKTISESEFKGEATDVVWAGGAVTFPSKSEVEKNLENAYHNMWQKFLKR